MKKLLLFSVFLVAFACSKEDEQKDVDPIVGNWRYVWLGINHSRLEENPAIVYGKYINEFKFYEDGTGLQVRLSCSDYVQTQGCIDVNIPIVGKTSEEARNLIADHAVSAEGSPAENCEDCGAAPILWTRVEETKTQKMSYGIKIYGVWRERSYWLENPPWEFEFAEPSELNGSGRDAIEMTFSEDYSTGSGNFGFSSDVGLDFTDRPENVPNILYKVN